MLKSSETMRLLCRNAIAPTHFPFRFLYKTPSRLFPEISGATMESKMRVVRVPKPSDFDDMLKTHKNDLLLMYFLGTELPDTGESWCPDTRRADPVIRKAAQTVFGDRSDCILFECPVGFREEY